MRQTQQDLIKRFALVEPLDTEFDVLCYTDASLRNGKAGYGLYFGASDGRNKKGALKGKFDQTSTSVELAAITQSLCHIRKMCKGSYLLRSDSLGAVNAIYRELGVYTAGEEYYNTTQVHGAASLLTSLLEIGYTIKVEWIWREHSYLRRANQLARYVVGCRKCVEEGLLHDLYALSISGF